MNRDGLLYHHSAEFIKVTVYETEVHLNLSTKNKNKSKHLGLLLDGPDAFGLLQLPQCLVPLGELL